MKLCSCVTHGCDKQSAIAKVRKNPTLPKSKQKTWDYSPSLSDEALLNYTCKWNHVSHRNHGSHGHLPPVKHCDFNLSVWLGVSHNLLSHKASTIHQTSSWNEHIYEHVANCVVLSILTVFLTLRDFIFFLREDHRFKFRLLTKQPVDLSQAPWNCAFERPHCSRKWRGMCNLFTRHHLQLPSHLSQNFSEARTWYCFLGNIISRPTPTQVSNCTARPAWHCGL